MLIKINKVLKFIVSILVTLILSVIFLEYSYQSCREYIADVYIKNKFSISCHDLKETVFTSKMNRFAEYSNVYEIKREKIGNNNGLACLDYDIAFVATDLSKYAKDYVAFHEYLHTVSDDSETLVNIKAGVKKPFGLIQTITYSLQNTFLTKNLNKCSLASLWKVFKVYFLNDSFTDLVKLMKFE